MQGVTGCLVLLAICLLGPVRRCDAGCDPNIDASLKKKNENPINYFGIFDWILEGEFQIVWMSSSEQDIANKKGTKCLKIKFEKDSKTGEQQIIYPDLPDKKFTVTLKNGALVSSSKDDKGSVTLTHRFAYISRNVVAFYICTDAASDPSLSIVAITNLFSKGPELVREEVQKGKYFLEKEGIQGFTKIPTCHNLFV